MRCEGARLPRRIDELEVEGKVHLCPFLAVDGTHVGGDHVHLGLVGRMKLEHAVHIAHRWLIGGVGRIVLDVCRLDHVPKHVDAEAVHAAVEPERITSYSAACTAGLRQLRSACSFRKAW